MRKLKRRQIAYLKSYIKNPEAASMFATLKEAMRKLGEVPSPPMYIVDSSQYDRLKNIIAEGGHPGSVAPTLGTYFGIDIAESPLLDGSTIVTARKRSDGSLEILSVEKLNV